MCTCEFILDRGLHLTILLFTSSSMALTSSAALGVSELLGRADRRDADWKRERQRERESYSGKGIKTRPVKLGGAACIQVWDIFSDYNFVSDQAHHCWVWTSIFHMSKYGLVGVISLIKGLIGGQVGANHRLLSGGNGGYEVGLGKGQALGSDCSLNTSAMIDQTTYIHQVMLLNAPLERELASATELSPRLWFKRISCTQQDFTGIYHLAPLSSSVL